MSWKGDDFSMSKTAVFGIVILFIISMAAITSYLLVQPVTFSFEVEINGNMGGINSSAFTDSKYRVPDLVINNPLTGNELNLGGQDITLPSAVINADAGKSNISAYIKGNIQFPMYALIVYQLSKFEFQQKEIEIPVPDIPPHIALLFSSILIVPAIIIYSFRKKNNK